MRTIKINPDGNYESELGLKTWAAIAVAGVINLTLQMICIRGGLLATSGNLLIPFIVICWLLGALLLVWGESRHSLRFVDLRCGRCGYSLEGLEKPRCPECGQDGPRQPFPTHMIRNPSAQRASTYGLALLFLPSPVMIGVIISAFAF